MDKVTDRTNYGSRSITISEEEKEEIIKASKDPDYLIKMAESIAPYVAGLSEFKIRLALQLFGGCDRTLDDGTKMRGGIHNLVIAGLNVFVSDILSAMGRIAPVSIPFSGCSENRMKSECGSSDSLLCIEDLLKYGYIERSDIHEIMVEPGISVLAAISPKNGNMVDEIPLDEKIDVSIPMLSQFDAISAITCVPGDEKKTPSFSEDFLRKYISYAKTSCNPHIDTLTPLEDAYISLREFGATAMQLASLVRLAEASARSRLCNIIQEADIAIAKGIIENFLRDFSIAEIK